MAHGSAPALLRDSLSQYAQISSPPRLRHQRKVAEDLLPSPPRSPSSAPPSTPPSRPPLPLLRDLPPHSVPLSSFPPNAYPSRQFSPPPRPSSPSSCTAPPPSPNVGAAGHKRALALPPAPPPADMAPDLDPEFESSLEAMVLLQRSVADLPLRHVLPRPRPQNAPPSSPSHACALPHRVRNPRLRRWKAHPRLNPHAPDGIYSCLAAIQVSHMEGIIVGRNPRQNPRWMGSMWAPWVA